MNLLTLVHYEAFHPAASSSSSSSSGAGAKMEKETPVRDGLWT
jgi:hypothetical protein